MEEVTVLGGGSFGTALAQLCARQGQRVNLWMRNQERAEAINKQHHNPDYLSAYQLSWKIKATTDLLGAIEPAHWLIVAVPSSAVRNLMAQLRGHLTKIPIVLACKGIEEDTLMTMHEVVLDVLGADWEPYVLALSGPSFAQELMEEQPTAVVLAGPEEAITEKVADILFSDSFRAYSSTDVVGVELGGALKNIIAIAAGGVTGMGLGNNTRAALVTRGVAEITRVAMAKGGEPLTLAGLAGVGDVLLTCTGALSRNRAVGQALGEGKSLDEALASVGQVAEGVRTTKAAKALVDKLGVDAPIISAVYRVLYEGQPARDALLDIVRRAPGRELK